MLTFNTLEGYLYLKNIKKSKIFQESVDILNKNIV